MIAVFSSPCSVESSEIDLSEFQEGNIDGADDSNDNSGQGDAQPRNVAAEPASGTAGRTISAVLLKSFYFHEHLSFRMKMNYCLSENGVGFANHQKEEYRVKEDYFQRVTQALVMRLRQHEETVKQQGKIFNVFIISSLSVLLNVLKIFLSA